MNKNTEEKKNSLFLLISDYRYKLCCFLIIYMNLFLAYTMITSTIINNLNEKSKTLLVTKFSVIDVNKRNNYKLNFLYVLFLFHFLFGPVVWEFYVFHESDGCFKVELSYFISMGLFSLRHIPSFHSRYIWLRSVKN